MPASFLSTPRELLHEIALLAIRDAPSGPPTVLRSLLLTCRMSHDALSPETNPHFYLMLFLDKFDVSSPRRHLSQGRLNFQNMEHEVKKRYNALQIIRRRDIWHPDLAEAFATLYVMLLEDDGRNWEQIIWAGLPAFMPIFMRERLLEGATDNHGWPLENELNTLAISLFWLTSSSGSLDEETEESRNAFMNSLSPFAFAGFRYPCFTTPEHQFSTFGSVPKTGPSIHRSYPPDRPTAMTVDYFGESTTLHLPPVAVFAILAYFARIEHYRLRVPPELPSSRQDAIANGILWGPTREDIEAFNAHCITRLASGSYGDSFDGLLKSHRHDPDRQRLLSGSHERCVHYIPGTFPGRWQGSFIAPYQEDYRSMLSSSEAPSPFPTFGRFPLYVRFREFYCYSPSIPLPAADDEISFFSGFLPHGCQWQEDESGIEIVGQNNSFRKRYAALQEPCGGTEISSMGALDVIITGVTEVPYAAAWNGYRYIGRVRPADGLVVLLRVPLDPQRVELGRALFRGYVVSSRNFVGRWRHISGAEQPADWESIFSLCKEVKHDVHAG